MPDDPNKEFTIQVNFSGVEKAILGNFKKQIDDVANAINAIAEVMTKQITALENIQKSIKEGSGPIDSLGGLGTGFGSRPPSGPGAHLAGASSGGGMDMSALVRELKSLNNNIERGGGGGTNLFGRKGNSGFSDWDQENSFEVPQYGAFTFQDVARQAGSFARGYRHRESGVPISRRELAQADNKQREDENLDQQSAYTERAYDRYSRFNPFRKQWAKIQGRSDYLREEHDAVRGPGADFMDKVDAASPYFGKGGVFRPNTWLNPVRRISQAGGTFGRFGMQFGNDQMFNPFSDSGRQAAGAGVDTILGSWGGFNPYLSSEQSKAITASVAGMGYSHGVAHDMRHMMGDVTQHTNIGVDTQAQIIDKSFRWGMANLHELANFMKNDIPVAATAARMNVGQFSQQLAQVASNMSSSRGVNYFTAAGQAANMSAGTGMNPGDVQEIMSDKMIGWTATQIRYQDTGEFSYGRTQNDPNYASYALRATAKNIGRFFGVGSADEIVKWSKAPKGSADYQKYSQFESLLALNPDLVPGLHQPSDINKFTSANIRHQAAIDFTANAMTEGEAASEAAKDKTHGAGWGASLRDHGWFGGTTDKQIAGKAASDKRIAELGGGRASVISKIKDMEHWSHEDKMAIFGHHAEKVGGPLSKITKEVVGDPNRHLTDIVAEANKRTASHVAKENEKKSKGGGVLVSLAMSPELKRLFSVTLGPGNRGVADGTTAASSSSPTISQTYDTGG